MSAKHTPMPWRLEIPEEGKILILGGRSKRYVASINVTQYPRVMGLLDEPERKANASLIVAAPELLSELEAAHQIIRNALAVMTPDQKCAWGVKNEADGVSREGDTRANERQAAISKAKGGAR